jgi:hypothetical protein
VEEFQVGKRLPDCTALEIEQHQVATRFHRVGDHIYPVHRGIESLIVGAVFVDNTTRSRGKVGIFVRGQSPMVFRSRHRELMPLHGDFGHQDVIVAVAGFFRLPIRRGALTMDTGGRGNNRQQGGKEKVFHMGARDRWIVNIP